MKSKVGKYIIEEWVNGDYKKRWVRRIDRETKTKYVSNTQRYAKNWDVNGGDIKVFFSEWAKYFRKGINGIPERIINNRSNTDGVINLKIVNNLTIIKSTYTFDELFNTDLRNIQNKEAYPLKQLLLRKQKRENSVTEEDFILKNHIELHIGAEKADAIHNWDAPIVKFLEDTFKVPVYYNYETVNEHTNQSKLSHASTYMHITHFGGTKKEITFQENFFNRTIQFWLFDDKLIFQYADGHENH